MVVQVFGVGHGFEQPPSLVERHLGLAPVPDPGPRFGFLGCQLDGDAVVGGRF
jgi:hypothetical protein